MLIFERGRFAEFTLSPNQKRIAVGGYQGLYVLNTDGSCTVKLSEGHGDTVSWVDNDTVRFHLTEGYLFLPYETYKLNDNNNRQ